nr:helix-turn-helix domain-containing protein [Actinoplanes brasiliensis]
MSQRERRRTAATSGDPGDRYLARSGGQGCDGLDLRGRADVELRGGALTPSVSVTRIVSAALECLRREPDATMEDTAKAAGVGRMTVYGHFRTRPELVETALGEPLRAGELTLGGVDPTGDARQAMSRLPASSWALVAESAAVLSAAQRGAPVGVAHRCRGPGGAADRPGAG